ncbi:hypothetical protein [Virgibacillus necropolis]|uniref:Uncharacterized protein n=1 Tax=Virgibacillus necropolis TaxID=163877 RepID=A0A221MCK3_9BACI|nr:hypothetical protein [Virgibacillus necropolis]ASN05371.1 hypothetical protein CFK40_10275 [Virgibacillus necropolis]
MEEKALMEISEQIEELIDQKNENSYFVYLTNREKLLLPIFMFRKEINQILNHMNEEIEMGFTNLWILERTAIYRDNQWLLLPENNDKADCSFDYGQKEDQYCTFIFHNFNKPSDIVMNRKSMDRNETKVHGSFKEAQDYVEKRIDYLKSVHDYRAYYALCAKQRYDFMWH